MRICDDLIIPVSISDTPRRYRLLHVALWLYCFSGMWAILASHGHYTLDVVVSFYITSRIFMYYQTFASNLSLMRRDRKRMRLWFPVFYFFEKDTCGTIKNEYECPIPSFESIRNFIKENRVDFCLKQYTSFRHSWCFSGEKTFKKYLLLILWFNNDLKERCQSMQFVSVYVCVSSLCNKPIFSYLIFIIQCQYCYAFVFQTRFLCSTTFSM